MVIGNGMYLVMESSIVNKSWANIHTFGRTRQNTFLESNRFIALIGSEAQYFRIPSI